MLNNIELFNECFENPVNNIDPYNREILNKEIIPKDSDIPCELLKRNTMLIELINEYNNYNATGDKSHNENIIKEIDSCLNYDGMNLCPFSQYLMVHDVNYKMYLNNLNPKDKEYILDCYIQDRHQTYLNRNYSEIIFQVLADSYSHKRKGNFGVKKISKICEDFGFRKIKTKDLINQKSYYILPDSDGKKIFKLILQNFHIKFDFEKSHQGKMPDILIKYNDIFIIAEHKTSKESGGGQDKQMTEIIDFINYDERGIRYVSYLDGVLFNELKNPSESNKLFRDKNNILKNLEHNQYNYFVNDFGFKKLLNSIINNS